MKKSIESFYKKLEIYQETLPEYYKFAKYEEIYDPESCHSEQVEQEHITVASGCYVFTWTHTDYDGDTFGCWFSVRKDELDKIELED